MKIRNYPAISLQVYSPQKEKTLRAKETSYLTLREQQLLNTWLDEWEKKGIQYFLDNRSPIGLVLDRANQTDTINKHLAPSARKRLNTMASIAATGYGLLAWVLAVEHKMLPLQTARNWALQTLDTVTKNTAEEQRGWMHHFLEANSSKPYSRSEVSSIDTVIFLLGALTSGEYFGGKVKQQANNLFNQVDFPMMLTNDNQFPNKKVFSHGFTLKNGERSFIPSNWGSFSEGIIIPLLALGSTRYKVPDEVWQKGWDRTKCWKYAGLRTFAPLPLFTYFYPLGFFNLKDRRDNMGENFWIEAQKAVKMQLAHCKDNGYPNGYFGLTACDGPLGYTDYSPSKSYTDKTISPCAILACLPLNEKRVFEWLCKAKEEGVDKYKYGLPSAYDPTSGWIASNIVGIDIGSTLPMVDAYRRGLIYKLSDQNLVIQRALQRAGFLC